MLKRVAPLLALLTVPLLASPISAQSRLGCDANVADHYEALATTTRVYIEALGPDLSVGNYPGDMRAEFDAFTTQRIALYRQLQEFVVATEDFAYAVRRCARE